MSILTTLPTAFSDPSIDQACEVKARAAATGGPDGFTLPTVSVVVATRARGSRLAAFAKAILADPATTELIIVFDGPDDDALERCARLAREQPRMVLVPIEHRGHYRALEAGVDRASSEIVLLVDDDVIAGPLLVTGHARHHARRKGIVVLGSMPVETSTSGTASDHVGALLYGQEYAAHCDSIERGDLAVLDGLWGGNVSVRRSDCLEVGVSSLDFPLFYHADQDFGIRLARAGLRGIYDPALAAVHQHHCDDASFLRSACQHGASLVVLHRLHFDRLGSFTRTALLDDLPRPLRTVVRMAGQSTRATAISRVLLLIGTPLRCLGSRRMEMIPAKLARRIMMWHGTEFGQGSPAPVVSGSR